MQCEVYCRIVVACVHPANTKVIEVNKVSLRIIRTASTSKEKQLLTGSTYALLDTTSPAATAIAGLASSVSPVILLPARG